MYLMSKVENYLLLCQFHCLHASRELESQIPSCGGPAVQLYNPGCSDFTPDSVKRSAKMARKYDIPCLLRLCEDYLCGEALEMKIAPDRIQRSAWTPDR